MSLDLNRSRHRSEWVLARMRVILDTLAQGPRDGNDLRARVGGASITSALRNLRNDGLVVLSPDGLWRITERAREAWAAPTPEPQDG